MRSGQFSAAVAEPITMPGLPIFPDVPQDRGHFPGPYYAHVLRGLRTSLPAYVADLFQSPSNWPWDPPTAPDGTIGRAVAAASSGRPRPPELDKTNIAGVILVTI